MSTIKFNLDKTEGEYLSFDGQTLQELERFLYPDQTFQDCCGIITRMENEREATLSIAALKGYGVYIGFYDKAKHCLSVSDRRKLSSVLDVWGDGLYVSEGLFIAPQLAWSCICEFVRTGRISSAIDWITPDELPENGNYI